MVQVFVKSSAFWILTCQLNSEFMAHVTFLFQNMYIHKR